MYSSSQNKQPQFAWGWRSGKRALTTNGQEGTSWNYSMSWLAVVWVPTVFRRYPLYFSFLAIPWSLWDLSSLTRDHAHAPCSGFLTTGPPRVVPKGTLEMRLFSSLQVIPQWSWQNMLFLVTIWTLRQCVSPGKLVKNLTWGLVPTPCPSQDELCVLHTGDFHKRGGLWAPPQRPLWPAGPACVRGCSPKLRETSGCRWQGY